MEPHEQTPCLRAEVRFSTQAWYLHGIPSYAKANASEGYPLMAKSAEAAVLRHMDDSGTAYAFIVRRHRLWPTASTGKARACTPECHDQLPSP